MLSGLTSLASGSRKKPWRHNNQQRRAEGEVIGNSYCQIELLKTGTKQINTKFIIHKCLKDGTIVNSYKTERECALSCGDISKQAHIHECINGSRKSAYGFLWRKDIESL